VPEIFDDKFFKIGSQIAKIDSTSLVCESKLCYASDSFFA
jgi:hypothetical protein